MPPKNPVRAARQAGRQQIRAAKDARKVAKIESRVAGKVAKINAKSGTKPAASTTTRKAEEPMVKMQSKDISKLPVPSRKIDIKPVASSRSVVPPAVAKKAAEDKKKAQDAAKKKQQEAARKKQEAEAKKKADAAAAEAQRVKDMFLQPGETRENTLPYPFTEKAKRDAARKAVTDFISATQKRFSSNGSSGNSKPAFEPKSPGYGQRKRGGAVKKSLYNKRK